MSDSHFPDAVSPEALSAFLRTHNLLPESERIPSVDLGGMEGGPCDLQFCLTQLIHRSKNGTNLIQILTSAMYLLCEAEHQFDDQLSSLALEREPYDQLSGSEQTTLARMMRRHLLATRASMGHLEELLADLSDLYYRGRAHQLLTETFTSEPSLAEFRSHMLISDGLLASLGLERSAVTTYINGTVQP